MSSEEVRRNLIQSGLWTALRTRPFSKSAVDAEPFAIFVNAMDTNPLAADPTVIIKEAAEDFKRGLLVLSRLTERKIHGKAAGAMCRLKRPLPTSKHMVWRSGNPAGLSGTHIHFIEPGGANKTVWTINYQDVIAIGRLFGNRPSEHRVRDCLGGSQVNKPRLLRTVLGAKVSQITAGELA